MLKEMAITERGDLCRVLILILMEHAQREHETDRSVAHRYVLILILMEHAQRARKAFFYQMTK